MAVRQYIGARYVLKIYTNSQNAISAEWEANTSYEPLTMVTYRSSAYISRNAVPATVGDPVSNPTYWALFGEVNGQIAYLQSEIDEINELIGNGELPYDANNIIEVLNRLTGTNQYAVFIGDSFTQASSLGADINKRYSTRLCTMLGLIEKNYAVGGTGFITSPTTFPQQALNAVADFTNNSLDPTMVKYVFVVGGANDGAITSSDADTYKAAVTSCLSTLVNYFTEAELIVVPYLWRADYMPQNYLEAINYIWQASQALESKKIRYVGDAYTWMIGQYRYILYQNGAKVHPNADGHKIYAQHMYSAVKGNNYNPPSFFIPFSSWAQGLGGGCSLYIDKVDNRIHLSATIVGGESDTGTSMNIVTFGHNTFFSMASMFMGDQTIMCDLVPVWSADNDTSVPKCYLETTVTMTGDGAGSWQTVLYMYNGIIKAGKKYLLDITVPFGVKYRSANI